MQIVAPVCNSSAWYGPLHNRSVAHPFLLAAFHSKFIGELYSSYLRLSRSLGRFR